MKLRDIPQYTRDGHYRIDVPLSYLEECLARYEETYGLDMDVDFQRAHVWTPEQQSAFVEHLFRGGIGSHEIRFNCPDWMGCGDIPGPMVVVDGKQRLTACLRFLRNEIPILDGMYLRDFEGGIRGISPSLSFRINDLETRLEVLQWYVDINTGGTPHTDEEIQKVLDLIDGESK